MYQQTSVVPTEFQNDSMGVEISSLMVASFVRSFMTVQSDKASEHHQLIPMEAYGRRRQTDGGQLFQQKHSKLILLFMPG